MQDELADAGRGTVGGKMAMALMGNLKRAEEEEPESEDSEASHSTRKPATIVNKTRIVHRVHTVRKFDMDHFRVVKRMCDEFMESAKEEYRKQ